MVLGFLCWDGYPIVSLPLCWVPHGVDCVPRRYPPGWLWEGLDRVQPRSFEKNLELVDGLKAKKGLESRVFNWHWCECLGRAGGMSAIIPIHGATWVSGVEEGVDKVEGWGRVERRVI
ncbi:hypothetical protein HOY80DRAFT_436610 [Tuber brumale]|nr:hypothetical protein HOY80DRAFT_436610 [Tuber brumale]